MESDHYHLILILMSLASSYFFSSVETAFTAMNLAKITESKSRGINSANKVLILYNSKTRTMCTILLGNTLANILASSLATALFSNILGTDWGVIAASFTMTFTILIIAETLPKTYAINNPERVMLFTAKFLFIIDFILYPFTWIIDKFIFNISTLLNLKTQREETSITTSIKTILSMYKNSKKSSKTTDDDLRIASMVNNILDIDKLDISHAMIHKENIVSIDINLPEKQIIKKCFDVRHSRIPFWEDSPNNIIGILHIKDLAKHLFNQEKKEKTSFKIRNLLTPPIFVPNTITMEDQLMNFRKQKRHLAIVVDEYGDLIGLITLEDVIEEIVGEIQDEHDSNNQDLVKIREGMYLARGIVSIRDINRDLNLLLEDEESSTIAGFIIRHISKIPNENETIKIDNLTFTIVKKLGNKLHTIAISIDNN